jgi:hypothetical protein
VRTGGITLAMLGLDNLEDATLRHLQRVARHWARQCAWAGKGLMISLNRNVPCPDTNGVNCAARILVWDAAQNKTCEAVLPGVAAVYTPRKNDGTSYRLGAWLAEATLARAAAKLGADYRPFAAAEEARPKDTDAVDGSTQQGDQTHGGDSASSEVPDGESGAGQDPDAPGADEGGGPDGLSTTAGRTGQGGQPAEGNPDPPETGQATSGQGNGSTQSPSDPAEARTPDGAPEASSDETDVSDLRANGSSAREVPGGEEPAGRCQDGANVAEARDVDDGSADRLGGDATDPAGRQPEDESPLGDTEGGALDDGAGTPQEELSSTSPAGPSTSARRAHGGVFAHLALRAERPLVREVRAALQRLVGDAVQDDGPRMDVPRSVTRLLACRSDWVVRREEQGRPALLVLVDVSGSCSRFCGDSVRIAAAVAADGLQGADVLVVVHSNGYPEEAAINNESLPEPPRFVRYGEDTVPILAWYGQHVASRDIRHVVVIGDGDGEWLYRDLAHRATVERVLWLDGYRARVYGAPRASVRDTEERRQFLRAQGWSSAAARKVAYVAGCGDAEQFADALRLATIQC